MAQPMEASLLEQEGSAAEEVAVARASRHQGLLILVAAVARAEIMLQTQRALAGLALLS